MIITILDRIRSAHNVGSFFRIADGAGVEKIYLLDYTPIPPSSVIRKTALGAERDISWEHAENSVELVKSLKQSGITIYAVETGEDAISYDKCSFTFPAAFIFGNEVSGIDPALLALADAIVSLPMRGKKHSLNVSTAGSVILYEAARQFFH